MTLVERDKELATLDRALTDCLTGNGQVVIVSGAVATGKTALLHSFAKRAAERGALLLTAVASRAERTLPLGVMYQLFRGADLPAASRERVGRLLDAGSLGALPADEGADEETDRLPPALQALCDESLNLAARHPTVIVIDDLQYADASSLRWVQYLARRLAFVGLMLVVADGSRSLHANARLHAEIFRQPYCRRLSLRLLSEDGVRAVLEDDVREPLPADAAPAYHQASGGNPLLVRALIDDRAGALAAPRAEPVIGDAYHRAVSNCLIRGEPAALQAAKALAILDSPCSTALIGRLAGLNAHTAAQALKSLAATGLVAAGRFRHGDMRRAVLDGAPPEERSTLHLTAAGLLYEEGAAPRTVARHLIAADVAELRRGAMPWCLPVLREAGEQALLSGEVTLAIACFRQAYQACKSDDDRVTIASELSRAERRVDPSAVARHLPLLLSALREGRLNCHQAMEPISHLLWFGRDREAAGGLELLRRSTRTCDLDAEVDLEMAELALSWCYPELSERKTENVLTQPMPPVSSLGLRSKLRAIAVLSRVLDNEIVDDGEDVRAEAEQILQGVRLDQAAIVPVIAALAALIYADRSKDAAQWCERLLAQTGGRQAPLARALLSAIRAVGLIRLGDLPAAERFAGSALKLVSPASWGVFVGIPLSALVAAMTAMGRPADADVYLDIPVPEAMFRTPCGLHYLEARGLHHLANDRLHAALSDFQLCGSLMTSWHLDLPTLVPWRAHSAVAALRLGRRREAHRLVREQVSMLGGANTRAVGMSLRVLAEVSEAERRPALLRESVKALQEAGDRLELAQAFAALDRALRENGRAGESGEPRQKALALATECGAEPLRRSLAADEGDGTPSSGKRAGASVADALSRSERRVAALAAEGHTNRQIARKLYITVSTVEQHLTNAYRKLDVSRRSDLPHNLC